MNQASPIKAPFPRTTREVFLLFRDYDIATGLDPLLEGIDFAGVQPRHVYFSVLGRLPELARDAVAPPGYDAKAHFRAALTCPEFQNRHIWLFLRAFPERQRLIFVHIPKCAGTHLTARVGAKYATLAETEAQPHQTPLPRLFTVLRDLLSSDGAPIYVPGHFRLPWYLGEGLLRTSDRIFTVVREPTGRVISGINYVLGRLLLDRDAASPDTQHWRDWLGVRGVEPNPSRAALLDLGSRILHDDRITEKDALCWFLGGGDVTSALDAMICAELEITDLHRYGRWLRQRWNLEAGEKCNESVGLLRIEDFDAADLQYIDRITEQDRLLYRKIAAALDDSPEPSILASALAADAD